VIAELVSLASPSPSPGLGGTDNLGGLGGPLLGAFGLLLAAVVGWWLKTWTDARSWRRQHALDAYLGMLEAADDFSVPCGRLWYAGIVKVRDDQWKAEANSVRAKLAAVDRAGARIRMVADRSGSEASFDLYVACERLLRLAIAPQAIPEPRYQSTLTDMVKTYQQLVEHGRRDIGVVQWQELVQKRDWFTELSKKRSEELNRDYPI